MLSLRKILGEQKVLFSDLGDRNPHISPFSPTDPILQKPILEKITLCLQSTNQSHILWALSRFPSMFKAYPQIGQYVYLIFQLFSSNNQFIEYGAICCCMNLAKLNDFNLNQIILLELLQRVLVFPAVEYFECIKSCISIATPSIISDNILPTIKELISKSESHQYAAGYFLTFLPYSAVNVSSLIAIILNSSIIINNYLQAIVSAMAPYQQADWPTNQLPSIFLPIANSHENMREGLLKTVLNFADITAMQFGTYSFTLTAFQWALNDENVGIVLVEFCDVLLSQKGSDFVIIIKELVMKLFASSTPQTKYRLIKTLASSKILVSALDSQLKQIIKTLSEEPTAEGRYIIITNFPNLISIIPTKYRDYLTQSLTPFFNDTDQNIHFVLLSPYIINVLGLSNSINFMMQVLKLIQRIPKYKYRYLKHVATIFLSLQNEAVTRLWQSYLPIFNEWAEENPHTLKESLRCFYVRILRCENSPEKQKTIVHEIVKKFGKSTKFSNRMLFTELASSLLFIVPHPLIITNIWPLYQEIINDKITNVTSAAYQNLPKFIQYFKKLDDNAEKVAEYLMAKFDPGDDEYLIYSVKVAKSVNTNHLKSKSEALFSSRPAIKSPNPKIYQQSLIKKLPKITGRRFSLKGKL
ncbi:hypothetical protein TVAG_287930 [Trichomonas vaginalis G3]|uniref:Uncharacterized protein n=1 Tax=Trichomonas vaginalis (strain ATCC PRA-98 / G3) TaxID=412133 RepID=A2ER60_TRIV3|nr:armadillo (ARM) repeat-containing protein family [Trichomonas vaginalis G3]EAY04879.1 hypothetical protein TVAG_287930 [Trichomonas vaginalis G3]KAI5549463.1 armadillo (ARM) repeat-containing protein family [Trichomonas vaginalis G3]|eukprot:XP_001317102.1 hypothetical protein [Trichomonas vaginalis G3]